MQNGQGDLDKQLKGFCNDNTSGSVSLFRTALNFIRLITESSSNTSFRDIVKNLNDKLLSCHRDMAVIVNLGEKISAIMASGKTIPVLKEALSDLVEAELNMLENSFQNITQEVADYLVDKSTIITISRSETVLIVLQNLFNEGKIERVIISESRPSKEGVIMAKELASSGIPVTLVVDSALDRMIINADAAIIGADAVYEDGSVKNKIGSRGLALSCKNRGIPFLVVSQSQKLTGRINSSVEHYELMPVSEITSDALPENISVLNFYFEIIEKELINCVIMEDRVLRP